MKCSWENYYVLVNLEGQYVKDEDILETLEEIDASDVESFSLSVTNELIDATRFNIGDKKGEKPIAEYMNIFGLSLVKVEARLKQTAISF